MNFETVAVQMFELFMIMGLGYVCAKAGYLDPVTSKKMNIFILNVTTPCLVISSVGSDAGFAKKEVFLVLLIAFLMYLILPFIALIVNFILRVEKENFGIYMFMTVFSNIGFMGYPVVKSIFGESGVFLCSLFNLMFGLFAYSLGVFIFNLDKKESDYSFSFREMINPAMVASVIAMAIFLLDISLPEPVQGTLSLAGQITSPLAMMLIGASLQTIPFGDIFTEYRLYPYTLIKQIAIPAAAVFLLKGIITDPLILGLTVVMIAMPVASTTNIFANRYDGNSVLASKGIFITTLCSFVTIPIICMFI